VPQQTREVVDNVVVEPGGALQSTKIIVSELYLERVQKNGRATVFCVKGRKNPKGFVVGDLGTEGGNEGKASGERI
jgi:hypothetical protein